MPKYKEEGKSQHKPYSRSSIKNKERKAKLQIEVDSKRRKPITKSEKVKNAGITDQLDELIGDLSNHLNSNNNGKKKARKDKDTLISEKLLAQQKVEEEQRQYEQTQNDLDDALGLLTKL